jgi:N6-adenosine-specific RNA methylase IME4
MKYQIIYMDPPWKYYGDPNKPQAAGKHYACMSAAELAALDVPGLLARPGIVYMWATAAMLAQAVDLGRSWGLYYRGIPWVWVKARADGRPIHGQGVRPSITKPTSELVLAFSNISKGRPLPVLWEGMPQVVVAPRGEHSEKPAIVRQYIERLHGPQARLEMFCRHAPAGWDHWGNEVGKLGEK